MSDQKRNSRAWVLIALAVILFLIPVAVVVRDAATPDAPDLSSPEPEAEPEPDLVKVVSAAPLTGEEPAPSAPAPKAEPKPEPKPGPSRLQLARMKANETAAIATNRNCSSAQAQFQASAAVDEDNDGTGEFGNFAEMSGGVPLRGGTHLMNPPVLSRAFKAPDASGRIRRSGYVYAIYIPGPAGRPLAERTGGGLDTGAADADLAETTWCMYAWPETYGVTGKRTFMVNQYGDVLATDCPRYSGETGPEADAAFKPDPQTRGTVLGRTAIGMAGNDGNTWKQVN